MDHVWQWYVTFVSRYREWRSWRQLSPADRYLRRAVCTKRGF